MRLFYTLVLCLLAPLAKGAFFANEFTTNESGTAFSVAGKATFNEKASFTSGITATDTTNTGNLYLPNVFLGGYVLVSTLPDLRVLESAILDTDFEAFFSRYSAGSLTLKSLSTTNGVLSVTNGNALTGLQIYGNTNTYFQANIRNFNLQGSADYVATADTGSETTNYLNFGINNSGGSPDPPFTNAFDGYFYSWGGNLHIGALNSNKVIKFYAAQGLSATPTPDLLLSNGVLSMTGNLNVSGTFTGATANVSSANVSGTMTGATVNAGSGNISGTLQAGTANLLNVTGTNLNATHFTGSTNWMFVVRDTNGATLWGVDTNGSIIFTNGSMMQFAGPSLILSNNSMWLVLTNGKVGVGKFGPTVALDVSGAIVSSSSVSASGASGFQFSTRSVMLSPADGAIEIANNAVNDFTKLEFGGTTAAFPALGRTNGDLVVFGGDGLFAGGSTNRLWVQGTVLASGTVTGATVNATSANITGTLTGATVNATSGNFTGTLTGGTVNATSGNFSNLLSTNIMAQAGAGTSNVFVGGTLFISTATWTNLNPTGTISNLATVSIVGSTLANAGDQLLGVWSGNFPNALENTQDLRIRFGGTTILDTGTQTASNCTWSAWVRVVRTGAATEHCDAHLEWGPGGGVPFSFTNVNSEIAETLTSTLNLQMQSNGSRRSGAVTNNFFSCEFKAAPR